jgi:uncharacterized protein (TIGR03437 family)
MGGQPSLSNRLEVTFDLPNTKFIAFLILACSAVPVRAQTCPPTCTLRFQTTLGGIDVVLTPTTTPLTVANFMNYVSSGAYSSTIIHRSLPVSAAVPPYIIQGGGYSLGPGNLPTLIPQNAPVTNEYNVANCPGGTCNVAGTIAMAQYGGNIDSATNQWYFNVADNSSTLDSQSFVVFGNVANASSLAVMTNINSLPTFFDDFGQDADFMNLPLQNYSCPNTSSCPLVKPDNYIFVNSISPISPVDSAGGVADAATAANNNKIGISPGEIITLYGTNLGPTPVATLTLNSTGTLVTTSLDGTQVTFNGFPGPMIFTLDGQIAVVVPYEIAGQPTVSVVVSYLGLQTPPIQFNVVPATPGLFTLNQAGTGDAAIIRYRDGSVISTSNPASVGDLLELYGEGYGVATPNTSLADGTVVSTVLPVPAAATTVLIDGKTVNAENIQYAGGAGGDVNGVLQINLTVPQLAPGSHQLQIQVGNAVSPAGVNLQTH